MRIAVAGLGYVGLSLACLLSAQQEVIAVDVLPEKVEMIRRGLSPISDPLVESFLSQGQGSISATTDARAAYLSSDIIIIATPTDYDDMTNSFDTHSIEDVLDIVSETNPDALVVIKSTVPVGYTCQIAERYPALSLLFSPEFLREGHALEDNLHPSRIVVGTSQEGQAEEARRFANLLAEAAESKDVPVRITGSTEAEAIKLFANTYLALRVSFFNELDTYAEVKGLSSKEIVEGVCLDPRIGTHYNNPSFGYGGYCLPKDSKRLLANYTDVPQDLIRAIVDSNATRKKFIAQNVLSKHPSVVGVYRLTMKSESDNFRQSAVLDVIRIISEAGPQILIYEPTLSGTEAFGHLLCNSLDLFKQRCDVILANRWHDDLRDVKDSVYTRDLWQRD